MKLAAAYIRVSTDDQLEYSPESQKKAIIAYAKQHDMLVPEEYIFTDEGISGRNTKRPAFQRMIGIAKSKPKPFDVILVWKFSRFARNREDSIVYKSMLRKQCNIDVISVSEQLGEDKTSILIEALLEAMDEYYSINLAEEVTRGMKEKAQRGGVMGGLPYGYQSEHGTIVINPETAPIVQKIFTDFTAGVPMRQIVSDLNGAGVRTRYKNLWDNRGIEYILRNIAYIGKSHWTPGGVHGKHAEKLTKQTIIAENSHPAIISEEIFIKAQERIAELKRMYPYQSHPQHGKMFMLKGLCRCSNCHATLVRSNDTGIQCHRYTTGKCKISHYISLEKINQLVIEKMQNDFDNFNLSTILKPEYTKLKKTDTSYQEMQLKKLNQQLQRVKEAYASGVDTLEEYKENKLNIQKQIETIQTELESVSKQTVSQEALLKQLKSVIQSGITIAKSDAPEYLKNEVLRTFIHEIIFDRKYTRVIISYKL